MKSASFSKLLPLLSAWLFASCPVIFLWAKNWEDVFIREVVLDLFLVLTVTTVLYFVFTVYFKNSIKASIATSISNFMFFSFGYIFNHASPTFIWLKATTKVWNYNVLMPLWAILFFVCLYRLKRTSEKFCTFLFALQNILGFSLFLSTSFPLFSRFLSPEQSITSEELYEQTRAVSVKPNIYYIILDEYARQDVLEKLYHLDNTPFLEALEKEGFFIAKESCSNYAMTDLSIPSILSMNFLAISEHDRKKHFYSILDYSPSRTIAQSPFLKILKSLGYTIVNVSSNFGFTLQMKVADIEMGIHYFSYFTEFLLDQSLLGPFLRKFPNAFLLRNHLKIILDQLRYLEESTDLPSPHFVFCHILCPHHPFMFDDEGEEIPHYEISVVPSNDYSVPYGKQVKAFNNRILPAIKQLISRDPNAVIIIQGDHGTSWYGGDLEYFCTGKGHFYERLLRARMANLNAYYLPGTNKPTIPTTITSVNTFRIILNHYLGMSLPLLPNTCHWSILPQAFDFSTYPIEEINKIELKTNEEINAK